ncbi:LysR family transcriptional regulator [Nocardia harenae]|uniref:LysR family transcriptional regulator n=1 Tax=Nocardia harenae TaxID=358707 RepID=UPI00082A098A|nr:LysR family transcriptional regulator [Nocardia harenae]
MEDLEVRELRYFVAVARHSTFSGAAVTLGMAQPPLSRAIRLLERRLGVELFVRSVHGVTLTEAGQILLDESGRALAAIEAAAARTRRAGLPRATLVAAAKPGVAAGLLRRVADGFAQAHQAPAIEIAVAGYRRQADMVRDGRADVAIISSPFDAEGLEAVELTEEPRVAVLAADHRLAGRRELRCRDLLGETFPLFHSATEQERLYWSGRDTPRSGGGLVEIATPAEPATVEVGDITELLEVIALGHAAGLLPLSVAAAYPRLDAVFVPVADVSPYRNWLVWPAGSRSKAVAEFVRFTVDFAAAEQVELRRGAS